MNQVETIVPEITLAPQDTSGKQNGGLFQGPGLIKVTDFDAIDYRASHWHPPDPELAVGTDHLVAVVNALFAVYDKNGNRLAGPIHFADFFSGLAGCDEYLEYPNALYDEQAGRLILAISRTTYQDTEAAYCVAVSATSNLTGDWHLYRFPVNLSNPLNWLAYPRAGVGRTAIFMGGNKFGPGPAYDYVDSRTWAFDKTAMYNGWPAAAAEVVLPAGSFSPHPLKLHGFAQDAWPTSGPHYFVTNNISDGATLSLWKWNNALGGNPPAIVKNIDLNLATGVTAGYPINAPQKDGNPLDAMDWRLLDFEYRNGYGWTAQTISCNPGSGPVNCVRWAQIDLSSGNLIQTGLLTSGGQHYIYPDLAVNHCQGVAVGYTRSSPATHPGIWVNGWKNEEPAGVLQGEIELKAGESIYAANSGSPYLWGSYTSMTIDPNGVTFWYLGQYSKNLANVPANWGTYVGAFLYPDCVTTGYAAFLGPNSSVTSLPGATVLHHFTLSNLGQHDDSYHLSISDSKWSTALTSATPLFLASGSMATVSAAVNIPHAPNASDTFTLKAVSINLPTLVVTATGTSRAVVNAGLATSSNGSGSGVAGEVIRYTIKVTNTGNYTDSFTIALTPENWAASTAQASTGPLAPGAQAVVEVHVTVGSGLLDSTIATFTSTLDATLSASVTLSSRATFRQNFPIIIRA